MKRETILMIEIYVLKLNTALWILSKDIKKVFKKILMQG